MLTYGYESRRLKWAVTKLDRLNRSSKVKEQRFLFISPLYHSLFLCTVRVTTAITNASCTAKVLILFLCPVKLFNRLYITCHQDSRKVTSQKENETKNYNLFSSINLYIIKKKSYYDFFNRLLKKIFIYFTQKKCYITD